MEKNGRGSGFGGGDVVAGAPAPPAVGRSPSPLARQRAVSWLTGLVGGL